MEKFKQIPQKEKFVCKICGGHHPAYACREKVDIEARRKAYVEKLKKGEPGMAEAMSEAEKEGWTDIEIKKEEAREALLMGRPEEVEKRKKALYEGRPPSRKE